MYRVHFVDPDWETTWGLGFSIARADGKTFIGHGGSCPGYETQVLIQPEEKIGIVAMSNAIDVNAYALTRGEYLIMSPAIKAALADSAHALKPMDPGYQKYLGTYSSGWGGESEVIAWEGGLAEIGLPNDNPIKSITKLRWVGENQFKRIRADGGTAEIWTFELGPDGRAARYRVNYNVSVRVR
jgi:hypothetical protein